jgi:hypothetical protein
MLAPVSLAIMKYDMLRSVGLHREFASLDTTPEAVKAFADRYGLLGVHLRMPYVFEGKRRNFYGEPLHRWQESIIVFGVMLNIWQLIQARDVAKLGMLVEWEGMDSVSIKIIYRRAGAAYEFSPRERERDGFISMGTTLLASRSAGVQQQLLRKWDYRNPMPPVIHFLHDEINSALEKYTASRLTTDGDVVPSPKTLLGAIWTMFALEVTGKYNMAKCPGCGQWFYPSTRRQRTCSDRCRVRVFRQRKSNEEV